MSSRFFGLIVCAAALVPLLHADDCSNEFHRAVWHPDQGLISASLMHPLHPSQQANAKWLLFDSTGDVSVPLARNSINFGDPDHPDVPPPDPSSSVSLRPLQPLLLDHTYYLRAQNVTTAGCNKPQAEIAPIAVMTKRAKIPTFPTSPSTSRDDSDFYFAPTIDGASGTKAAYTLDAKLQFRKGLVAPAFGSNTSYRPGISFIPGVDLRISSNPKEDGNSVTFQLPLEVLTIVTQPGLRKIIPAVISRPAFVAEADKKFHDINALFSESEYLVLHGFGNDVLRFVPEPMVGFETGTNLKAQQAGTYPGGLLRGTFGMRLVMTFIQSSKAKPVVSIESNYIRRLLLNPEPVYTQDSKGNLVLSSVGTNPRDHVDLKATYALTQYVGLSLGYEYGELPPVFTKVDNKYTFGITFKGQLQYKPANSGK